jgi:IQ calmodulin-binding motif-containing protein 1
MAESPNSVVSKLLLVWHRTFPFTVCFLFTTEAPSLKEAEGKEPEHFLSRSRPVATKAKQAHLTTLKHMQAPWWKKLGEEPGDGIDVPKDELSIELGTLFIGGTKPP